MGNYAEVYQRSIEHREAFWAEQAEQIHWDKRWDQVLDDSRQPLYRWFVGGMLNTCFNALDRHVASGRGGQDAIIYDSAMTGVVEHITYAQLLDRTARFAGALRGMGVGKGDRVIIYMPMIPQAAVAMLACARLGAVHSVVFGGFAPRELAARIDHALPKVVVSASCGLEPGRTLPYKPLLDQAIEFSRHKPERCVIFQRPQARAALIAGRDLDWAELEGAAPVKCVPVAATDPLYILYTSGTTGQPKGVVRDNGGHAVALRYSMEAIYGLSPGEVCWTASDVGWVVGHSYIVYAPLFTGCTSVLYEGKPIGTPDAGAFWRVIEQHRVRSLFTAPTAFRAIKREDPDGKFLAARDLSSLRTLFLAGERCDPATLFWAQEKLKIPVIDHWWQTETGWPIVANCYGLGAFPVKPGSATKPVPGYEVRVLDESGNDCPPGESGAVAIKLPLPPGCLPTLHEDDAGYIRGYLTRYPGHYLTGDGGFFDEEGYLSIMGRMDDVINVAGHRLSTGQLEEVLAAHPDVAECAVIGVDDALKGEVPLGLVVLKNGTSRGEAEIVTELIARVRDHVGPVAFFKLAAVIKRLPKTRSGKVLRGTMKKIADGKPYKVTPTIEEPAAIDEIATSLAHLGYPKAPPS